MLASNSMKLSLSLLLTALVSTSNCLTIYRRGLIPQDQVVGFPENAGSTNMSASLLKYKPYLEVVHGCVPFPAVDIEGNTGSGISIHDGPHNNKCNNNLGQVYARATPYNGVYALMYSWYMPADKPSIGIGHRHDWEGIVVWISSIDPNNQTLLAVAASRHGDFYKVVGNYIPVQGIRPKIKYFNIWPLNHGTGFTSKVGGEQPLIAWDALSDKARVALSEVNFESATVMMKDSTFEENLKKAWFK